MSKTPNRIQNLHDDLALTEHSLHQPPKRLAVSLLLKYIALSLSLSFVVPSVSPSQWLTDPDFDLHTKQGIDHVYNLEFDQAETRISLYHNDSPGTSRRILFPRHGGLVENIVRL